MKLFQPFKKKKPNIIMLMIDGVRSDTIAKVSYYNELKKSSVFFPNMITYAPYTIASLYAMFSGMYGNSNGVNGYYKSYSFDKEHCFTLTQYLKEKGYHTETDSPGEGVIPPSGFDKYRLHDEFKTDFLERHIEVLHQIKNKSPFFLFLRYGSVHVNMVNNFIKKYSDFDEEYFSNKNKNSEKYLKWVEESGNYLHSIIKKIKEIGLYDNSIIIIFTDHGASTGDRLGEKAYGVYLYDYTIRCFLYMIGNGFSKGKDIKELVRSIDVLPTLLDFLKIKEKRGYKPFQGKSFLPFIQGKTQDRTAYAETGGLGGPTPSPEKHNVMAVRTNKWKLIYNDANKKKEMYDIENDPQEKNNLTGKHPDIEGSLWQEMANFKNQEA